MTEAQWLGCQSVYPMTSALARIVADPRLVHPLKGRTAERKFRLLACALARHAEPSLKDPRSRTAVAERFADGAATRAELQAAFRGARAVVSGMRYADYGANHEAWSAAERAALTASTANHLVSALFSHWPLTDLEMVALIRDVFGNPFRLVDAADFRKRGRLRKVPSLALRADGS